MRTNERKENGFSLVELLVAVAIVSIGAVAIIPNLQTRIRQSSVDAYAQKLESGLTHLKANMIGRQDTCILNFPSGEIRPSQIDAIKIDETSDDGDDPDCPTPDRMGGASMASTKLRLLKIRNSHTDFEEEDLKITISPSSIALNTIGGVTAPSVNYSTKPLIIRVRSETLEKQGKGHERCIEMETTTGLLISGTWQNHTDECLRSR